MERLQPLITHRFWILFGLVLILPVIGWWMVMSSLAADTAKRKKNIDSAFSTVNSIREVPNPRWVPTPVKYAEIQKDRNKVAWKKLWTIQRELMIWPDGFKKFVPKKRDGKIAFYGKISPAACSAYKYRYDDDLTRVWLAANPYGIDEETQKPTGAVLLAESILPRRRWDPVKTPNSKDVWQAQQDLWLIEGLLQAIRDINGNSTEVSSSIVRKVDTIQLLGGSGEQDEGGDQENEGGFDEGFAGDEPEERRGGGDPLGDDGGEGGIGTSTAGEATFTPPSVDFAPETVFGKGGTSSALGGEAPGEPQEYGNEDGGENQTKEALRYVGEQEEGMYLKRGFYMKIVIDQRKLPDFLVRLENSSWPTTISRVQMVKLPVQGIQTTGPKRKKRSLGFGRRPATFGGASSEEQPTFDSTNFGSSPDAEGSSSSSVNANALNNPYLWEVTIAGLMVLYNPPPEDAAAETLPAEAEPTEPPPEKKLPKEKTTEKEGTAKEGTEGEKNSDQPKIPIIPSSKGKTTPATTTEKPTDKTMDKATDNTQPKDKGSEK